MKPLEPEMTGAEFEAICRRRFRAGGGNWRYRAAECYNRQLNTIHCYVSGRRVIPAEIAHSLRFWDRMTAETELRVAARMPEEQRKLFLEWLETSSQIKGEH